MIFVLLIQPSTLHPLNESPLWLFWWAQLIFQPIQYQIVIANGKIKSSLLVRRILNLKWWFCEKCCNKNTLIFTYTVSGTHSERHVTTMYYWWFVFFIEPLWIKFFRIWKIVRIVMDTDRWKNYLYSFFYDNRFFAIIFRRNDVIFNTNSIQLENGCPLS